MTERSWTSADVSRIRERALRKLLELSREKPPQYYPRARTFTGWHEAAAVLSLFDPASIRPVQEERGDLEQLLADCIPSSNAHATNAWTLLPDVRSEVLAQLHKSQRLSIAISANEQQADPARPMLEACIRGALPPIDQLDLQATSVLTTVSEWVRPFVQGLPPRTALETRLDYLRLLQPFERLAGTHFRGRAAELQKLRDYVGVLPPGSLRSQLRRWADLLIPDKPPLVIHGPGGIGKSTLVARFLLDHAHVDEEEKFPFAYLDFDRPGIAADEPVTLLMEVVRQLGVLYPHARPYCEQLRADWHQGLLAIQRTLPGSSAAAQAKARSDFRTRILDTFLTLLQTLGVEKRPLLIVFDTFEEVQYRGSVYLAEFRSVVAELRRRIPLLRTVLVGRAPVEEFDTISISVQALDQEAAQGFLQAHGVDPAVAKSVAERLGGMPLTLRLAAAVLQKESGSAPLQDLSTQRFLIFRLKESEIQARLFRRILAHIHDEDVRKIAHPGLVMRRITPELIQKVLAEPCGVKVGTPARAQALFEELSREVSLVSPAPEDGALVHRPDVRRVMLDLLRESEPERVADIHRRAVDYYATRSDKISRAEEIYHRLSLRQPTETLDKRWTAGLETYLAGAVDDFVGPERAWLATRIGIPLDDATRASAAHEVWEREAERRARELVRNGSFQQALTLVRERPERSGRTDLDIVEAQVLVELGRKLEAARIAERAAMTYARADNTVALLRALIIAAAAYREEARPDDARRLLDEAAAIARFHRNAPALLEIGVTARDDTYGRIAELVAQVPDGDLAANSATFREALLLADAEDNALLLRALKILGLSTATRAEMYGIQEALRDLDRRDDGRIADELRTLVTAPPERLLELPLSVRLTHLLEQLLAGTRATPDLRRAVTDAIAGTRRGLAEEVESVPDSGKYRSLKLSLTPEQRLELERVLETAFTTRGALGVMLHRKLGRDVNALSFQAAARGSIADVVSAAERRGWLVPLIAAARDARFENPALLRYCDSIGMGVRLDASIGGKGLSTAQLDPYLKALRREVGTLQARTCAIEIAGKRTGTGFLVTPSVIVTAASVAARLRKAAHNRIRFRFDYGELDGTAFTEGISYAPARQWLAGELDFRVQTENRVLATLIRLEDEVGRTTVGPNPDEVAPIRGFVSSPASHASADQPLLWLWYPEAGGIRLSGVNRLAYADEETLTIPARARHPFEGAPCIDQTGRVVAVHCGSHPHRNHLSIAVGLDAIHEFLGASQEYESPYT